MIGRLIERFTRGMDPADPPSLRVRIFRSICAAAAALSLLVAAPMNLFQNLPAGVHVVTLLLGLSGAAFAWLSYRGRNHFGTFFAITLLLFDVMWFWNAGSLGSITYFFLPVVVFSLAIFQGRTGWLLVALQLANIGILFTLERIFPDWVTPFHSPSDRLLDLSTSLFAACVSTALIVAVIVRAYEQERRQLAEAAARLKASDERQRVIFNATSDAMFVHAADGRLHDVNARACEVFGFDHETALRLSFNDCSLGESPYSAVEAREKIALALGGQPQVFEWLSRRYAGDLFWAEVALRAGTLSGEPCVIASVRDISARKQVQHELLANEERLRLAMLASRQGWFEINVQTGTGVSSPEYPRILGYEPSEFVTTVQNWIDGVHPDDRAAARGELRAAIETGETRAIEYRRHTRDGGWKWIRTVGRIIDRDSAGRPLRMIGMHADITERKELEAQLLHSQRLEAVGTLASGVAHDLNNILTPMLMAAGLLQDKLPDPEDREMMGLIESSGHRGAAIVKQLLAFSRAVTPERRPLAPVGLIHEVARLIRSTFPKEITLVEKLGDCRRDIEGDSTQLHQVLVNLAVNARDAMPGGGTLTLGLECCTVRPPGADSESAPPESYLVLSVADTGHGIPPEIRERIFDPFFTTKEPGKGTGLGLATVHGIVTAHRGFIRFESSPDRGTEFRVYLPASVPKPGSSIAAPLPVLPEPTPSGRTFATILFVDDEPAVLRTTRRMLEREGFEVLTAASGAEALQTARERAADIELVITDFMMPEMDGPTLVPLLRQVLPSVKIVGVSGLDQRARAAELGLEEVLCKPFDGAILLPVIHRILARK